MREWDRATVAMDNESFFQLSLLKAEQMHCRSTRAPVLSCTPLSIKKTLALLLDDSLSWNGFIHHAEFVYSFWLFLNTEKMLVGKRFNVYILKSFKHALFFFSHKASSPCKILNIDYSFWLLIWKWLFSLLFSFGFLIFKCFVWRGWMTECSGHFVLPQSEPLYNRNQI